MNLVKENKYSTTLRYQDANDFIQIRQYYRQQLVTTFLVLLTDSKPNVSSQYCQGQNNLDFLTILVLLVSK